jgi:hypothetical protein
MKIAQLNVPSAYSTGAGILAADMGGRVAYVGKQNYRFDRVVLPMIGT